MKRYLNKKLTIAVVIVFIISGILGYILTNQLMTEDFVENLIENLRYIFDQEGNISLLPLFLNNVKATSIAIIMGFIPFLYLPFLSSALNGMIIGVVLKFSAFQGQSPVKTFVIGILPHGIFELTAIFLSLSIGVSLSHTLTRGILKKPTPTIEDFLKAAIRTYITVIIPLLAVAAGIETFIVPRLIQIFM